MIRLDMKTPCKDCPFRRDVPFHLRPGRVEEIIASLMRHENFPCHKTLDYSQDDDLIDGDWTTEKTQHCAGAMILLMRLNNPNLAMRLGAMLGAFDPDALNLDAPVYADDKEMIAAYERRDRRITGQSEL